MGMSEGNSFLVSSLLSILSFSAMQVYKSLLASSQVLTIVGGFAGSVLFVFLLTAVGNLEKSVFGPSFQTQLKEVVFCLVVSTAAAGSIHRVCATTCFILSLLMVWSINNISAKKYSGASSQAKKKSK